MSVGQPLVLPGVGGSGPVEVRSGSEDGELVVNQQGKLVTYNLEDKAVLHTWYTEGEEVRSAVTGLGLRDDVLVVAVTTDQVVLATSQQNKLGECERLSLGRELEEVTIHLGEHWLVFSDGMVERLSYFRERDRADWIVEGGGQAVLEQGERIMRSSMVQVNTGTRLCFLVEDKAGQLVLVRGQLVLDPDNGSHSVARPSRVVVGQADQFVSVDLSPDQEVCGVRAGTNMLVLWNETGGWEEVTSLPSTSNCGVKWLGSSGHVSVMGSMSEGGYMHLINVQFKARVGEVKLKNTLHCKLARRAGAMDWVGDRLYLAISNKLLCCRISGLGGGLSQLLGKLASPDTSSPFTLVPDLINTNKTSELVATLNQLTDLPEQLLLDCVLYFLDSERTGLRPEAQLCYLGMLFNRGISEVVMEEQLSRLTLSQVVSLLHLLDNLLHDPAGAECKEAELVSWVSLLLNSHYLQLAVARDEKTRCVVKTMQDTVARLQESARMLADSRTLAHNIVNTRIPTVQNNKHLAYCIEVIQI